MLHSLGLRGPAGLAVRTSRGAGRWRGLLTVGLLLGLAAQAPAVVVAVDPNASLLRVDAMDGLATAAVPIELAPLGILPGDFLRLQQVGDYLPGAGGTDTSTGLIGVFSSSSALAAGNVLNRVSGAIDAGLDVTTAITSPSGSPTDIAEDFRIDDVKIEVPVGATHLFVAVDDDFYGDNGDPDFDLGVIVRERPSSTVSINPRLTYLRVNPTDPFANLNAVPIALASRSLLPGDEILLRRLGDWAQSTGGSDTETSMIAVFSGSNVILGNENPNRIPGAKEAGIDVATPATANGSRTTDIPEDFQVNETEITVPTGATHLFVSVIDDEFDTNADPDNDFAIVLVPEPVHELLAIAALATLALLMRSEQRAEARRSRAARRAAKVVPLLDEQPTA